MYRATSLSCHELKMKIVILSFVAKNCLLIQADGVPFLINFNILYIRIYFSVHFGQPPSNTE